MRRRWVLPLLVLSGAAGLAYELLWVRLLALGFGATTASFSVVLAVFFGGMAAGARWAGHRSLRTTTPLRTYAALEGLTGALGLGLYPLLKHVGAVVAAIDPGPGPAGVVLRLAIATAFLLPPTFLMGATLPFVSAGTIDRDEETGPALALIYAVNTVGACVGAFVVTFFMLPRLGVFGSTLLTASLNFLVAAIAFFGSRRGDGLAARPSETQAAAVEGPGIGSKLMQAVSLAAFTGGLVATGCQVVWGRLFAIQLRGTSYGIGSVLVAVLLGIAGGSLLSTRAIRRSANLPATAAKLQALGLFGVFLFVALVPVMTWVLSSLHSFRLEPGTQRLVELLLVVVFLAVPCGASGASLPTLVAVTEHSAGRAGLALARLYAANTVGCIAGSILTGFFLLPQLGSPTTLYLLYLALAVVLAIFVVAAGLTRSPVPVALLVLALAGAAVFPEFDLRLATQARSTARDLASFLREARQRDSVIAIYEGDVATAAVSETAGGRGLHLNGLGQGSRLPIPPSLPFESVLVATVPWLHAGAHHKALVVGLGAGGTVATLSSLGVERVEVAELEDAVVSAVSDIWGKESPLFDQRVQLIRNDARHHLLTASRRAPGSYDLITSMPAHPWVASTLFTREFFALAKENLSPTGVFSTWFGADLTSDEAIEGLIGAFTEVFPHWVVYWVPEVTAFFLVGSPQPLSYDVERATALGRHPALAGLPERLTSPTYLSSRIASAGAGAVPVRRLNTDDNGLLEFSLVVPRTTPPRRAIAFLPVQAMPPSLVKGADVEGFVLDTFEQAIGSPQGRLPVPRTDAATIRRAASMMKDGVSASLRAYAELRALLAEGKRDEAAAKVAELTEGRLRERAQVFLALSEPPARRADALAALPATADVLAARTLVDARTDLPPLEPPPPGGDPLTWLFVPAEGLQAVPPEQRARALAGLLGRLSSFGATALYERCTRVLAAGGWSDGAGACRELGIDARRREARGLVQRALEAGSQERYADAVRLLLDSNALAPLTDTHARLLLQTAVKLADAKARQTARELLLARGVEPVTIDALEALTARQEAERKAAPPPPPDGGP